MDTTQHLWIPRTLADELYERIIHDDGSMLICMIQAPAGAGKTFLARDLGARLGSPTGYESIRVGRIAYSGILDVYDSDTNSNSGIERRLLSAFSTDPLEFEAYQMARQLYDAWFKSGILGAGLEEQRKKVERAFSEGLQKIARMCRPVIVLDTIERVENTIDRVQKELDFVDDTTSVMGYLNYQLTQLPSGVVILLGRRASRFQRALQEAVSAANHQRSGMAAIEFRQVDLGGLDEQELPKFFERRQEREPRFTKFLDEETKTRLAEKTEGNPLLLDLALQALASSSDASSIKQALTVRGGIDAVGRALLDAYMNSQDTDHQTLLTWLAVARNGLFADLLKDLEPAHADRLIEKLAGMKNLPFIKTRDISVASAVPGAIPVGRRTYFLHDAMYTICDAGLLHSEQVKQDSQRIVEWYDQQIKTKKRPELPDATQRLLEEQDMVESLFYRMRADPVRGYEWYLRESDRAIRGAKTGLDMRLRDGLLLFNSSAMPKGNMETGQTLSSPLDSANVSALMPYLFELSSLDSAMLWIKRLSVRGDFERAKKVGETTLPFAETLSQKNPELYTLPFAELLLWYGQTEMYGFAIEAATRIFNRVIGLLRDRFSDEQLDQAGTDESAITFEVWRLCLVLGRTYNNLGYAHWMYSGEYRLTIREFQQALHLFRTAHLEEEVANSSDNLGRIYATLGREAQAIQLIKDGLKIRQGLGLVYRTALSGNSLAQAYIRLGQFDLALREIEDAVVQFKLAGVERGIGLGLVTRGTIYRNLGENWRESDISVDEATRYINLAETDLRDAVRVFTATVRESIREIHANNEMGCCYRARYLLLIHKGASGAEKELALSQAHAHFRRAIDLAAKQKYVIDELDSMQDLAVLLFRADRFLEAQSYLDKIAARIPESHKYHSGEGLAQVNENERVDAYYKLMGQVELLYGAIEYERGTPTEKKNLPGGIALEEITRRYLLAVAYFHRYADKTFADRFTYNRIYERYKDYSTAMARQIMQTIIPKWSAEYQLPKEVGEPFLDIFGLI
jgi:tetratricopeptide (TPR) repeat protein